MAYNETDDGNGTLYKVNVGSFKSRNHADKRVALLDSKGIDSFIVPTTLSGEQWYRIQAGAFSKRANAENLLNKIKDSGIEDVYILTENAVSSNDSSGMLSWEKLFCLRNT